MFLAAIDQRKGNQTDQFWDLWEHYSTLDWGIPTTFDVSIKEVRDYCSSPEAPLVRCWTPKVSYYAKANGDFYPCCLIGGEAVRTFENFRMAKAGTPLQDVYDNYVPGHYYCPGSPCRGLCQYKQLNINLAGEIASNSVLSMP